MGLKALFMIRNQEKQSEGTQIWKGRKTYEQDMKSPLVNEKNQRNRQKAPLKNLFQIHNFT